MATFTITTEQNIDELARGAGDLFNINGGKLTIDQDSRYGYRAGDAFSMGTITISATLGGELVIDARKVRLIPFVNGSGVVPNGNDLITQGGASGKIIAVWSDLGAAPAIAGGAMPTSGYIKVKQWNDVEYSAGALTGITADATGPSVTGWIDVVGNSSATVSVPRLGKCTVRGDWFYIGTTTGVNTDTYVFPSSGKATDVPVVWVETSPGSNEYEAYPRAGSIYATEDNVGTDAVRGKWFWHDTYGLISFGSSSVTYATGGYVPPAGCKIRIPNVILLCCTAGAGGSNALSATLATRYDFTTTGGGVIDIDKATVQWYMSIAQAYSVQLTNVGIITQLAMSEIATPMTLTNVAVGQEAAFGTYGITMSLCFAGGTFTDCTWTSSALSATGRYIASFADVSDFSFVHNKFMSPGSRGHATTGAATISRASNCSFDHTTIGGGRLMLATCTNLRFDDTTYYDRAPMTTIATYPHSIFDVSSNCSNITIDGLDFGGLHCVSPYSNILAVGAAGCSNIKLRNLGTAATPLSCGGPPVRDVAWTRVTTAITVTVPGGHGLGVGTAFYVLASDSTAAVAVGAKTVVSVASPTEFTFTGLNAGNTSGLMSYEPTITGYLLSLANGSAAKNVEVKRCYVPQLRTGLYTGDNSAKGLLFESVYGPPYLGLVTASLNVVQKGLSAVHTMTGQTSCYGTHWFDAHSFELPPNLVAQAWTRVSTVATVTSTDHKLITGALILVTATSSTGAIILGKKTITVVNNNTFTFACLNAGDAVGTITYTVLNARVGLLMNEATAETANVYTIDSGLTAFTSAGSLFMPAIGDQITFTTPYFIKGHNSFPIDEAVMAGGTITDYDISYAIDQGSGYGAFHNLSYYRPGVVGTNGSYTFTLTDVTGVEVGNYVWGLNIGPLAKVTDINTGTNTVTVDRPNIGTLSVGVRFGNLPNEVIADTDTGFKMQIRLKTIKANTTAMTSLYFFTQSTTADRSHTYVLDSVSAQAYLYGLKEDSEVRIYKTSDMSYIDGIESSGTSFTYPYMWYGEDTNVFIVVHSLGYVPIRYENMVLGKDGLSIPVQQQIDRVYSN